MSEVYIIDALRTPVGRYSGQLSSVRPDDMMAMVIKELVERNKDIDPKEIEEVIIGCANQAGEDNRNVARMSLLLAGLPIEVGGITVNRLCASGLQAIMDASRAIHHGDGDVYIAGGVESMSRAPFAMPKSDKPFGRNPEIYDTTIGWRFTNPKLADMYYPYSMGETAENVAEKWSLSREEQDNFALESQQRYKSAHD
ncbi:MAG: 3-oxoadipyl-CoA thiolase, partial [Bacteroidetes bacterium]|nr:3-oxoadipyl-CoA thiolase [Bacteroidota bacterium]